MTIATRRHSIDEIRSKPDLLEGRFDRATAKEDARTVELSFSSEEPVLRWYGWEILSHEKGAVNMERLASGRANVLVNHEPGDWVGVVESARVGDDKKGRATVRFGSGARASEVFRDVRDGILTSVSVGYSRDEMKLTRQKEGEEDEYTITRWTPIEVSLVTIPADSKVGVGRAAELLRQPAAPAAQRKETSMNEAELAAEAEAAEKRKKKEKEDQERTEREAIEKLQARSAVELEQGRRKAIESLCKINKLDDRYRDMWIGQGVSLEAVTEDILKVLEERGRTNPQPASRLGLTRPEAQRFSLGRAIVACRDGDWKNAPFELECSREVAKKLGRLMEPTNFFIPFEVMERPIDQGVREYLASLGRRDLTVATAGAGGFLVGTENMGFIEMLRNRSVAFRMGVRQLSGLQGSVTVPRQSAAATAVWLANEASTITESQQTFVQMALTPKSVGAYTEISDLLLKQSSPGAEGIVTDDLAQQVALAADLAVLEGSGAGGQPTGIANTAGIGAVTGTSLAYAGVLEFQTDVATANVMPARGGYVTTPAVASLLMQRQRFTSTDTPLWVGNIWDGVVSGFPGMSSNQLTAATMIFGDWQEGVVGEWGVLEVTVNPFANFQAGIIGVRALYSLDVGIRRPFAFSRSVSIT
jgi:HK97 family phage major capsid protein/HK97 family phage prohead protease